MSAARHVLVPIEEGYTKSRARAETSYLIPAMQSTCIMVPFVWAYAESAAAGAVAGLATLTLWVLIWCFDVLAEIYRSFGSNSSSSATAVVEYE